MYTLVDLLENFPAAFDAPRPVQLDAFQFIAMNHGSVVLEIPTGEGKTAIGVACAATESAIGTGPSFYITPGKVQVGQVVETLGDEAIVVLGRSDYECLYYVNRGRPEVDAQQSICYTLDCPHRVNQETGEIHDPHAEPCTYYQAKWDALVRARDGGTVVTTVAWFLMNRMLVRGWNELDPALVVIDEAHRVANIARSIFETRITDHHLYRAIEMLTDVQPAEACKLRAFADGMVGKARRYPSSAASLLAEDEIVDLMRTLEALRPDEITKAVREKLATGELNPVDDRDTIKTLEHLALAIPRMVRNLRYATSTYGNDEEKRSPLGYVVAYYFTEEEMEGTRRKASVVFELKSYYVRGLIQKALAGAKVVAMSATIGNPDILTFETGIGGKIMQASSSFNPANTRVYLPTDTPNLAHSKARRDDWKEAIKRIVTAAKRFTAQDHRCLVVVTSEAERQYFRGRAERDGLEDVLTYEPRKMSPKVAAERFRDGEGMVLLGTSANYAEGIDLPGGIAPVTFMLRPGYANPSDAMSQFEERKFGTKNGNNRFVWQLRMHRAMIEAQQVRGRNVRSAGDVGVTFFVSQGFRNFLKGAMPSWLESAYRGTLTLDQGVDDALKLLKRGGTAAAK